MINVALVGNPNTGKTTVFNALTGSKQYVGNWPGVTIDKKFGFINKDMKLVDLPGIYAMDTYSNEEKIARAFLEYEDVDVIINVVDSTNLERNLYLTTQLMQFNKPIVVLLNMIDIAKKRGINIDHNKLAKELGVTILPISAKTKEGLDNIEKTIIESKEIIPSYNINFKTEKETYTYIDKIINKSSKEKGNSKYIGEKIDKLVLNPVLAYPIFLLALFIIFKFTFSWFGQPLADGLDAFVADTFTPFVEGLIENSSLWFQSLIVDGIVAGVGGVIVFFPIVFALFLGISFLEDSGYMSRVAFLMDKIMRKIGLSGKAFIPIIMGFGCSAPAIMATRTLESEKDRKMTALLAPLVSCGARLPVYALFASIFFSSNQELVVMGIYLLGIIVAILVGLLFKNTLFKKDEQPFILELPEYKLPSLKSIILNAWDKSKGFIVRAGTLIFAVSIVVWFLTYFNMNGFTEEISTSFFATLGGFVAPIFEPLGFGTWEAGVSILTGLAAKEVIIGTMEIVYGDLAVILPMMFTTITALTFLIFVSLYTPCFAVIGVMRKEYGNKMMLLSIVYQFILAWIVAYLFKFVATLVTGGVTLSYTIQFLIFLVIVTLGIMMLVKYFNKEAVGKTAHLAE
ncbi:ferrous iron transport protein B [Clostridium tertium]|jgi:ferrous iron transport protein B|uniref:ferrous iron transport protein B n=1 Tax=Clostridium TaxID=1485 RepID=UPI000C068EDD|nr:MULTISPECIES: ferrous iron transport protein B [Clostridium]MBU6134437.1 ferrous iron transport protein B [Clostridium tertium]MDB1948045.1 ferrous iron transport protein B [Clostridium tertium]MDB1953621.1 ferrous iron transport protein B [Clostridium tertium]MDB1959212.1 ferrous iron transport protein B [Clostridium tertium]MDB1961218.1 ferrous iron transport protein B [Clostridium tertium]